MKGFEATIPGKEAQHEAYNSMLVPLTDTIPKFEEKLKLGVDPDIPFRSLRTYTLIQNVMGFFQAELKEAHIERYPKCWKDSKVPTWKHPTVAKLIFKREFY